MGDKKVEFNWVNDISSDYKDITNQKPKLDESDDFDWVKDEVDRPIRFSIGDKIRVINVGDVETFIDFLGTAGVYYRKGILGPNIEGEIIDGGSEYLFALREKNKGKIIFLPSGENLGKIMLQLREKNGPGAIANLADAAVGYNK